MSVDIMKDRTGGVALVRRILSVLRNYKRSAALLFCLLLLGSISQGIGLALIAPLLAAVVGHHGDEMRQFLVAYGLMVDNRVLIVLVATAIVGLICVGQVVAVVRGRVAARFNYRLCRDWQKAIFHQFVQQDLVEIRSQPVGLRLETILHHPMRAAKFMRVHIDLLYQVLNVALLSLVLMHQSPLLTVLMLAVVLLGGGGLVRPLRRRATEAAHRMRRVFDELSAYAAEQLIGLLQIKLYRAEAARWKGWASRIDEYERLHVRQVTYEEAAAGLVPVVLGLCIVAGLAIAFLIIDIEP
ncbi:MAG: ABC transporter ATP-binding protein, partial [Phycisphaerae bacterium]|nr:ABC transporter ATP-binding protein [Phycisphaerae bacterium]